MFRFFLKAFFAVVYFLAFLFLLDLIFRNFHSVYTDLLTVACMVAAFIASVGLAVFTEKKIAEKYRGS